MVKRIGSMRLLSDGTGERVVDFQRWEEKMKMFLTEPRQIFQEYDTIENVAKGRQGDRRGIHEDDFSPLRLLIDSGHDFFLLASHTRKEKRTGKHRSLETFICSLPTWLHQSRAGMTLPACRRLWVHDHC